MRLSISFCFFSFSLILLQAVVSADIIEDTCKKVTKGNPKLSYDFCVKSLGAVHNSHNADLQRLGVISAQITMDKAGQNSNYIGNILAYKPVGPVVQECLEACMGFYSKAISSAQEAINDFRTKDYASAKVKMSAAMNASVACEDGFKKKKGTVSPVTKENKDYSQLAAISLGIIKLLRP